MYCELLLICVLLQICVQFRRSGHTVLWNFVFKCANHFFSPPAVISFFSWFNQIAATRVVISSTVSTSVIPDSITKCSPARDLLQLHREDPLACYDDCSFSCPTGGFLHWMRRWGLHDYIWCQNQNKYRYQEDGYKHFAINKMMVVLDLTEPLCRFVALLQGAFSLP